MTELDRTWAKSQVEAMADESLAADAKRRMQAIMAEDPEIAAEVERAKALRRNLRLLVGRPAPRGQLRRLWTIPGADRPRAGYWAPAMVLATVAAAALGISVFLNDPGPSAEELAQEAAVQDLAVALAYLQRSAELARSEVNEAVGDGMRGAMSISRQAVARVDSRIGEGVNDNAD